MAPSSTALGHAAVFGMTAVLDVLVAAGARIDSLELAAAAVAAELKATDGATSSRVQLLDMYQGLCILELPK